MSNYIYKFINYENEIIYVGKTGNIMQRIKHHFSNSGHLPQECYEQVLKIFYADVSSKYNAELLETYFINKYHPKYNNSKKYKKETEDIEVDIVEPEWKEFLFVRTFTVFGGKCIEKIKTFPPYIENSSFGMDTVRKALMFNYLKLTCYEYEFKHFAPTVLSHIPSFTENMNALMTYAGNNINYKESNVDIYVTCSPEEQADYNYVAFNVSDSHEFFRNPAFKTFLDIGFIEHLNDGIYVMHILTLNRIKEAEQKIIEAIK